MEKHLLTDSSTFLFLVGRAFGLVYLAENGETIAYHSRSIENKVINS
jgi:hypothetical protein